MTAPSFDRTVVDDLTASIRGEVLLPGDDRYDAEAAPFNVSVAHHPAVIVAAADANDVVAAVEWAVGRDLPIAVQGTGHGAVESADGALLVSTKRMTGVTIDPLARTAQVEAGAKWKHVLNAATEHGLATLNGSSSDVGVVGYTVGGGMPVLGRAFGWGADMVRAVDLVTPDGRLRHVTAESEPDLFWAVRGGKGNFGIVTSLLIDLLPVEKIYGGAIFFPGDAAPAVLRTWRAWVQTVPDEMCTSIALLRLPDLPGVPPPLAGKLTVHLRVAYVGDPEEGERLLAPMRAAAPAMIDAVAEMPYAQVDEVHHDPTDPTPAWERGLLLRDLPEEAVEALLAVAGPGVQTPLVVVELRHLGGALSRPPAVADAVSGRGAAFSTWTLGVLVPPIADIVPVAGKAVLGALQRWKHDESALNFIGDEHSPEGVAATWAPETRARLQRIKGEVDPRNLLRIGHTIAPAAVPEQRAATD